MLLQEKEKLLNLVQKFVNDNMGQLMTVWNGGALFGTIEKEFPVTEVSQQDQAKQATPDEKQANIHKRPESPPKKERNTAAPDEKQAGNPV